MATVLGGVEPVSRPTTSRNRIAALDALRGFALFGVIIAHVATTRDPVTWADRAALWIEMELVTGRSFALFAFLFGLGFSLQAARAAERGAAVDALYTRRLLVLFAIGASHALLLYSGDILATYALLGLPLLLLRRLPTRALMAAVVVCMLLPGAIRMGIYPALGLQVPRLDHDTANLVLATGGYGQVTAQRLEVWLFWWARWWWSVLPATLALFVLGLAAGRAGLARRLDDTRLMRRLLLWAVVLTAAGVAAQAMVERFYPVPPGGSFAHLTTIRLAGTLRNWPQALVYLSALMLLWHRGRWAERLRPLSAVGRMALTNYLLASAIFTTAYYGYGLGLYGQLGDAEALAFSSAIFALQLAFSTWWLARFRFGPVEWIWRTLTYGRLQPLREAWPAPAG